MNKDLLERIQKIATPAIVGVTVAAAAIVSAVQIRRAGIRRKKWAVPVAIIGAVLLAGITGAIVEYAVESQPRLACQDGSYVNDRGVVTCRAILSLTVPEGATARCYDGVYSFNHDSAGLCARHGGVALTL